jgi:NADH:ubiquinone oxidoreductase subunit K
MKLIGFSLILFSFLYILRNSFVGKPEGFILILLSLEIFFIGLSLLFLHSSLSFDDLNGLLFSFFLLSIAAIESAIGLSLLLTR